MRVAHNEMICHMSYGQRAHEPCNCPPFHLLVFGWVQSALTLIITIHNKQTIVAERERERERERENIDNKQTRVPGHEGSRRRRWRRGACPPAGAAPPCPPGARAHIL